MGSVPAVRVLSVATLYESDLIGRASVTEFRRLLLIWEDSLLHAHWMHGRLSLPSGGKCQLHKRRIYGSQPSLL